MRKLGWSLIPLLVCALSTAAQQRNFPTSTRALNGEQANSLAEPVTFHRQINLVELQQEADDLARTAQTIPIDMANVRKGNLPKDVIQKLKQIEKLSKHLRSQIMP
ncbi:MAG TPA: hypothetical protein VKV39_03700 [Candidatus Sulfotelmatobacter sp.]|nr:hypothetical protein [Candidatus Sulfotelmatobacter sp.]